MLSSDVIRAGGEGVVDADLRLDQRRRVRDGNRVLHLLSRDRGAREIRGLRHRELRRGHRSHVDRRDDHSGAVGHLGDVDDLLLGRGQGIPELSLVRDDSSLARHERAQVDPGFIQGKRCRGCHVVGPRGSLDLRRARLVRRVRIGLIGDDDVVGVDHAGVEDEESVEERVAWIEEAVSVQVGPERAVLEDGDVGGGKDQSSEVERRGVGEREARVLSPGGGDERSVRGEDTGPRLIAVRCVEETDRLECVDGHRRIDGPVVVPVDVQGRRGCGGDPDRARVQRRGWAGSDLARAPSRPSPPAPGSRPEGGCGPTPRADFRRRCSQSRRNRGRRSIRRGRPN